MMQKAIGNNYLDETIKKMQDSDGFSIRFDESEIHYECEVMAMLSSK